MLTKAMVSMLTKVFTYTCINRVRVNRNQSNIIMIITAVKNGINGG